MQGELVDGRYRLEEKLGEGGMGEVWSAQDVRMRRPVAVKLVRAVPGMNAAEVEQRFMHEVRSAAALPHRHTVTVHDCGEATFAGRRFLYLVMELLHGETLARLFGGATPVPWYDVAHWGGQIATALSAAHERGIVHRDIKPQNVMLTEAGVIKVLDFGLAKFLGETLGSGPLTLSGAALGTFAYMSPEQCRGDSRIDHRADLYSLGCLLYEGLTGHPPFTNTTVYALLYQHVHEEPRPLPPGAAPSGVADLVMRLLAKDPADRPQDALTVVTELHRQQAAGGRTVTAPARGDGAAEVARMRAEAEREIRELRERAARDAAAVRETAERHARQLMENTKSLSEGIIADANAKADRIRRESERELAALTRRRESIAAQLTDVRAVLAQMTGAVPAPPEEEIPRQQSKG
ncbi:serine/threonine-protein kinase [Streptomyces sp. NPDC089915]|uniref:serine/threonine-protein kinase n=1 Tax=Streptomyces sp. NPDC089915 TaxID=3155186 RepID=UPI003421025A